MNYAQYLILLAVLSSTIHATPNKEEHQRRKELSRLEKKSSEHALTLAIGLHFGLESRKQISQHRHTDIEAMIGATRPHNGANKEKKQIVTQNRRVKRIRQMRALFNRHH